MANWDMRNDENVAGALFVDVACITCDTCTGVAPMCFSLTPTHAFVHAQPRNAHEAQLCQEAILSCPVDAIGMHHA
jgi:ferredoxin